MLGAFAHCRLAAVLLSGAVVCACSDAPSTALDGSPPLLPTPPSGTGHSLLRGQVDLAQGTLSFGAAPLGGGFSGWSPAIYGDQYVTVRLYNSPVVTSVIGSKRRFTAGVGIENLRNHPVGDEQGGASPADTMGIFVFFTANPTVTGTSSSCPSCAVAVQNYHGTLAFTALAQRYFHWPERLGAAGSATDTTRNRVAWTFEADTAVTGFSFEVLVSAAWAAPNEAVWRIEYSGDSLPDTQAEPPWRRVAVGTTPSATAGAGFLNINIGSPTSNVDLHFQQRDSMRTTTSAFAEARIRLNSGTGDAHTGFGFDDNTRQIELGMSTGEVGFIDDGYGFINKVSIATNVYRTYQIRKFAADSVQLWIDGTRRLTVQYGAFKPNNGGGSLPSFFRFGSHGKGGVSNSSDWDYVIYSIGSATP
jgi:hypothetical protein